MSGGTAFVLDLEPTRVNTLAVDSGELLLLELDDEDRDIVRNLIATHVEETGSQLAERLLDNFDDTAARMTKVLPRDYAAVQQTRLGALEEGLDPDGEEVWSRILEVTGG
jgi:glutamate synthase (NADPH/NADH) large chain